MITALHPPEIRTAVKERVDNKRVQKDYDQAIAIMYRLKTELQTIERYEVGRREASRKAVSNGIIRHSGRQ